MKKLLSLLLVLVTMLAICTSLVACGGAKPNLDFDSAKQNLAENGYSAYVEDAKGGYFGEAIEQRLIAHDEDDDYIYIYEFKDEKAAKLYYNDAKIYYGKNSAEYKFYKHYLKKYGDDMTSDERKDVADYIEELENYVVGRSGKYVWYGTKDAVNATK